MFKPWIKRSITSKRLSHKPCAVIMGRTGAGKTTLANKLCRTSHDSGAGRGSVTRVLYRNDVSCGKSAFSLIDTPGIDSSTDTYKHAVLLKESLTATKLNTIFIIIKYEPRFDKMTESYWQVELPISKYPKKIVVMISNLDQSKNPEKDFKEICEFFEEECPNLSNIIFYSEQSSNEEIANLMYSCISNMEEEELRINDKEFALNFNTYEMKGRMKQSFDQYINKANGLENEYSTLISSIKSEPTEDKDEILHMIIVEFKDEMEMLLQQFKQEHGSNMQELDCYQFLIKMQRENVKICDQFVSKVVKLMSYSLFDNQDPRNLIKRCPYCKLIWYKTEGCDGSTDCGNNGFSNYYDVSEKPVWKYVIQRENGKLKWSKNPMEKKEPEKLTRTDSKRYGCGKEFVWSKQPPIEKEIILELYKVKTIDEAIELIKKDNYVQLRENYERGIDRKFYS